MVYVLYLAKSWTMRYWGSGVISHAIINHEILWCWCYISRNLQSWNWKATFNCRFSDKIVDIFCKKENHYLWNEDYSFHFGGAYAKLNQHKYSGLLNHTSRHHITYTLHYWCSLTKCLIPSLFNQFNALQWCVDDHNEQVSPALLCQDCYHGGSINWDCLCFY